MQDPPRDNIDGRKVVTHQVSHHIDWGYVGLALAVIAVVWFLSSRSDGGETDPEPDGESAAEGGLSAE